MSPWARIAREIRFASGLGRVFWRIRKIDPDSPTLICDDWEQACARNADHTALEFEGERYTYRQLDALANRFAAWALSQNVARGETVALLLHNRPEYVPAWMGLAKVGAAAALINTNLTGAALAHCLSIPAPTMSSPTPRAWKRCAPSAPASRAR
jgi:fatty-acyl-CoA synthase